jgi:hypothetical protein
MDRLGALLTAQRWSIANAINNAISAAATAQAMPIMIRFIILTTFANPTGYARLTLQRSRSERVACEFSGLTIALQPRRLDFRFAPLRAAVSCKRWLGCSHGLTLPSGLGWPNNFSL